MAVVQYLLDMRVKHKAHCKPHGFTPFHVACKVSLLPCSVVPLLSCDVNCVLLWVEGMACDVLVS